MFISPTEAIRRYDVSKPTLYSDMKEGKLSFKFDDRKKRKIDVSELDRLYEKREENQETTDSDNVKNRQDLTQSNVNTDSGAAETLRKEVEFLKREIESRQDEVERWQSAFEKAQATADKITALLEDQRASKERAGEWQQSLKALETRIANQEKTAKDDKEEKQKILRQNQALKKALEEEKSKGFWKRLFG